MRRRVVYLIVALLACRDGLIASPLVVKPIGIAARQKNRIADEKHARTDSQAQSVERVPVNLHPNHPEILTMLKQLAASFGKTRRNTFYVSPVERQGESEHAYIYWKQDNSIIILNLPLTKPLEKESAFWLYNSKARIDLVKGVVPTKEQVGTSTFLVSKPWVERVIKDCIANGLKISLPKRKSKRPKTNT